MTGKIMKKLSNVKTQDSRKNEEETAMKHQSVADETTHESVNQSSEVVPLPEVSRLIAKNLPGKGKNKWTEERIRAFFGKFGKITDVKMKVNEKTGACRFVFIGFEEAKCCKMAIDKLNGTFLQGTKLMIEECKPLSREFKEASKKFTLFKSKNKNSQEGEDVKSNALEQSIDDITRERILDTGRLFLRNLSYSCSEDHLSNLFKPFGPLAEVECIINKNGQCKGYAFCTFMFSEHALAAFEELDGNVFMGRVLHIIAGEEKIMKGNQDDQEKVLSSFQRERLATRKKQAVETKQTWNALFLGSNAVAETLVENYDVEKRHLLLDDGENSAAVRVAMGETQLVRETRKFLLDCGVKLDAFSRPLEGVKRSKTVILVKNLSAKPNERDHLQNIFARYGDVKNVIMPPAHGITALVEMGSELEAKKAFEALAYANKVTKNQPLYLEWAPMDVFDEAHPRRKQQDKSQHKEQRHDHEEQSHQAKILPDKEEENADGTVENCGKKEPEITKILVRNVPFQANMKEITQLFSAFGELRFVRMPKKPGAEGHRGFCFVDFISVNDARRAMDSLVHSTHLYGRRLVLEWAKEEESIQELRSKTKRKAQLGKQTHKKIRSFANTD